MHQSPLSLRLSPRRISSVLVMTMLVLIGLAGVRLFLFYGLGMEYSYGAISKVDLDWENNLPTYFSTVILLFSSVLLTLIFLHQRRSHLAEAPRWGLLAVIFLLMSIDEASSVHELLITPLRERFDLSGLLYFSWVVVAMPILLMLAVLYVRFVYRLPAPIRGLVVLAAGLYVGGAVGLELLGGERYDVAGQAETLQYELIAHTEEILEMTGIIVFINALLRYISATIPSIDLTVKRP